MKKRLDFAEVGCWVGVLVVAGLMARYIWAQSQDIGVPFCATVVAKVTDPTWRGNNYIMALKSERVVSGRLALYEPYEIWAMLNPGDVVTLTKTWTDRGGYRIEAGCHE